jgi:hypothetical protein
LQMKMFKVLATVSGAGRQRRQISGA